MADKKVFTEESLKTLIEEIKSYTDNAAEQKSQVQIVTWESDD